MLAKKYRLLIQQYVRKSGKIIKNRYFQLKVFPVNTHSQFGVIISKAVSSKATIRNYIKRIVFQFFADIINTLPIAGYLIIVYPESSKLTKQEILKELKSLLSAVK